MNKIKRKCSHPNCDTMTENAKYCSLSCGTSHRAIINKSADGKVTLRREEREKKYYDDPKLCKNCSSVIPFSPIMEISVKFCGRSCGASHQNANRSQEMTDKAKANMAILNKDRRQLVVEVDGVRILEGDVCKIKWIECHVTSRFYCNKNSNGYTRWQSPYAKDVKEIYLYLSKFRFNVKKFSNYFDLIMLKKLGWYTCPGQKRKNEEKNTNGVSRDHLYSVSEGFKNSIHPFILAHPANCRIMPHIENVSKHGKCSISIEQLIEDIRTFKYEFKGHQVVLDIINRGEIYIKNFELLRKLV